MPLMSVVIPFGLSKERPFIQERIIQKAKHYKSDENIEFIFVEGYSSFNSCELKALIEQNHHIYIKDEKQNQFSQGQCRNLGASFANADVLLFLDADYYLSFYSFKKILKLIRIKNIAKNPNALLVLPVIFLTEEANESLKKYDESFWDSLIQEDLISGKNSLVKFFAPNSSSIIINKHRFLGLGGYDENFIGHGYEDFDFLMRVLNSCLNFEKMPSNLDYDARNWNFYSFKGLRAWFSLLGYETCFYGIYTYHIWHIEPNQNGYMDNKDKNHKLFYKHLKNIKKHSIIPLQNANAKEKKVLLVCKHPDLLFCALRGASVYLGELIHQKEEEFFDKENFNKNKFLYFLQEQNISQILFPNPYGNEKRKVIYDFARDNKLSYLCFDRGALPDSWFFDDKGFNADSSSYDIVYWNKKRSEKEIIELQTYIYNTLFKDENYLEPQGKKEELSKLRKKLNIDSKKEIIFIPLQVQSDTVITHFTYEPFTYEGFLQSIDILAKKLEKTHIFIIKKHPLSLKFPAHKFMNVLVAPNNTNIINLLELCDKVLTLNSGVGVYAMMMKKPCILCAQAFYQVQGVNYQAKNESELENLLCKKISFDENAMLNFIAFLKNDFYSFGVNSYVNSKKNHRIYRKVNKIDFYQIIIAQQKFLQLEKSKKSYFSLKSFIYKPYIFQIHHQNVFVALCSLLLPDFIVVRISHTRFYRLLRKLLYSPKDFIKDSKKSYLKKIFSK